MNKPTTYDPMLEAPADAQEKIRAMFAAMDRMDERIARAHKEIAHRAMKTDATLSEVKALLDQLQAGYK